jgi:hypothetical protein
MTHILDLGRSDGSAMLHWMFNRSSAASGQQCVPQVTDISCQIRQKAAWLDGSSSPSIFQNPLNSLKVFIMSQTEVAAPDFPPVTAPTFTQAAVRFVVSFAALLGLSLLLAGL